MTAVNLGSLAENWVISSDCHGWLSRKGIPLQATSMLLIMLRSQAKSEVSKSEGSFNAQNVSGPAHAKWYLIMIKPQKRRMPNS